MQCTLVFQAGRGSICTCHVNQKHLFSNKHYTYMGQTTQDGESQKSNFFPKLWPFFMDFCGYPGDLKCVVANHRKHHEEHLAHLQCCGCGCVGTYFTTKRAREVLKKGNQFRFNCLPNQHNHNTVCLKVLPHDWDGYGGPLSSVQTKFGCHIYSRSNI